MAIIHEKELFVWSDLEISTDLSKISFILRSVPDEEFMLTLEKERGPSGVNKYPVRAVWNSLLVSLIVGHDTIESLRRELKRNPALCDICGFDIYRGAHAVPSSGCYSRFIRKVVKHQIHLRKIFQTLQSELCILLPDFGENLAADGKALSSFGRNPGKREGDQRGEHEADWGKHTTRWASPDGRAGEKIKKWFGFTLHLIADTKYELPVEFNILPASVSEQPVARRMIDQIEERNPEILVRCRNFCGDKGYDNHAMISKLWDDHGINPIIDTRMLWKDTETDPTRAYDRYDGVIYDQKGNVYCISPDFGDQRTMANCGFDKSRNTLKFRCPAEHYGLHCRDRANCKIPKNIRIPLSHDPRIFTSVSRSSYKWKRLYNSRSAIERVNSRIDSMFGFKKHTIRGQKKMTMRVSIAFILMLAFAVGKIQENREAEIRRFLSA